MPVHCHNIARQLLIAIDQPAERVGNAHGTEHQAGRGNRPGEYLRFERQRALLDCLFLFHGLFVSTCSIQSLVTLSFHVRTVLDSSRSVFPVHFWPSHSNTSSFSSMMTVVSLLCVSGCGNGGN